MPGGRPFRFAVTADGASGGGAWRDLARKAEDLGYDTLQMCDHLGQQWGPLVALAVAAEATTTLRVGTLVLDNDFRHPVVLAKELATLDQVSGGRLEWGMGAGWVQAEYESAGIPFDPARVRLARLRESIRLMKGLFARGTVDHQGRHFDVHGVDGFPAPRQRPHPPLLIGGQARRLLSFAARRADIVGVGPAIAAHPFFGPDRPTLAAAADQQVAWIRAAAADRDPPPEVHMVASPVVVSDDRAGVLASLAASQGRPVEEVAEAPHVLVGSVEQICDELEQRRDRWDVSYWSVPAAAVDQFAPVVARLRNG